jgi:hypothetical protein
VVQSEEPAAAEADVAAVAVDPVGGDAARHRQHRFPGPDKVVKVRYDADEHAAVASAAGRAGLTTAGYVASAALAAATDTSPPTQAPLRELLSELLAARTALRRYAVNLNQAVAALNAGADAPVWLPRAAAGASRAVAGVDEVTAQVSRQLC